MPKDVKIGLLWHSNNSGNLGVGALTIANMAIVRGVLGEFNLNPIFTILAVRDDFPPYVSSADATQFDIDGRAMIDPSKYWATVKAQDCVLDIGGGDSFTDIYANRRYAFLWATKALTILAGTPLLLSPQTIGPFNRQPHTALAAWAVKRSVAVIARDEASMRAAEKLAPKTRRVLCADVAFGLPYEDQSHLRGGDKVRVGVNVSGLLFNEAVSGRNKFGLEVDYADLTRSLISALEARNAEVHLITHVVGKVVHDDDGLVADRVASEFPNAIRVSDFRGPCEAKSYISGLDFLVSGRMHSCIAAVSSGTPAVPIAYSRKFSGVFGLVAYPWLVDVAGHTTHGSLEYIMNCFDRRAELARDCDHSMQKVAGLMEDYRTELRALFQQFA